MGRRQLREAIKVKGFLVSDRTMHNWFDRYHGKCNRGLLAAPNGLPTLDAAGLRPYEEQLLRHWNTDPDMTYTQLKEFLEQTFGRTCSKNTMMHWMQSPFQTLPMVSIDVLRGDFGRPGRSTCVLGPCPQNPQFERALVCKLPERQIGSDTDVLVVRQKVLYADLNEDDGIHGDGPFLGDDGAH